MEIARHMYDFAEGFRQLGHEVDTLLCGRNPQHPDLQYTYEHNHHSIAGAIKQLITNPLATYLENPKVLQNLRHFLTGYDVYVFQFGSSILPNNRDYSILKQLGKQIITVFNGSETRHWSTAEPIWASQGLRCPEMYREAPFNDLNARMRTVRMAERYADAMFSHPSTSGLSIRPYKHFYLPFDMSLYRFNVPAREIPVVVHAPSRRATKGTDVFLETLEQLKRDGVRFDLRLLEGVTNSEVISQLVDADVVLDQLDAPTYGMFALEGLATGCAVAGGNTYSFIPVPKERPVVHLSSDMLYEQLRVLLTDRDLRVRLAHEGRKFAEQHHGMKPVAERMLQSLDPLHEEDHDYYPTFVARQYELPEGEVVADDLKRMTTEIVQRWGLPEGVEPESLIERGLMSSKCLDPSQPIIHWKKLDDSVVEEAWGWSWAHSNSAVDPAVRPGGRILQLGMRALAAVDRKDFDTANLLLQACIDYGNTHPEAFDDYDALLAIGRLALALNQPQVAVAMLQQAQQLAPEREGPARALESLQIAA